MMYVAIVVSAVATMVVGALWYSPLMFGNVWMKEMGFKMKDMEKMDGMWKYYTAHLVTNLIQVACLWYAIIYLGVSSYMQAMQYVVFGWFVFVVLGSAGSIIWEGRSIKLFSINVLHLLVSLVVSVIVLMALLPM